MDALEFKYPYLPSPAKVAWGMVAYGPFPYAPVYASHMCAVAFASRYFATKFINGDSLVRSVGSTDRMYTHSAENLVAKEFLESDCTHLFMTEMDMVLPIDIIPALLALDKPVASGLYFLRGGKGEPCLYVKTITPPDNPYPHTPVRIFPHEEPFKLGKKGGCPGLGCVLIRREVFEKIEYPYFDLKENGYGSDMYFYTKVRDAGFEVWVDPRMRCGHMDYTEVNFEDHLKRLKEDPEYGGKGFILNASGG